MSVKEKDPSTRFWYRRLVDGDGGVRLVRVKNDDIIIKSLKTFRTQNTTRTRTSEAVWDRIIDSWHTLDHIIICCLYDLLISMQLPDVDSWNKFSSCCLLREILSLSKSSLLDHKVLLMPHTDRNTTTVFHSNTEQWVNYYVSWDPAGKPWPFETGLWGLVESMSGSWCQRYFLVQSWWCHLYVLCINMQASLPSWVEVSQCDISTAQLKGGFCSVIYLVFMTFHSSLIVKQTALHLRWLFVLGL